MDGNSPTAGQILPVCYLIDSSTFNAKHANRPEHDKAFDILGKTAFLQIRLRVFGSDFPFTTLYKINPTKCLNFIAI